MCSDELQADVNSVPSPVSETMSAYPQFGYPYSSASQLLVATSSQQSTGSAPSPSSATSPCCETGRPIGTDPVSGQTICSCQYDSARLALSSYPRLSTTAVPTLSYAASYPSTEQNPYPSIGVDSSAFYSPLGTPYALKDGSTSADMSAWTSAGLQPTTGYYPYDPTLAAYGYGAGYDLAARRKNATRESTATLKAWLNEHKKNPYPTKGEKIMLAIITKMTLTQVSTWFANARRRLKKENKMTWEPKNKTDDDEDAVISDSEGDGRDRHDDLHEGKDSDKDSSDEKGIDDEDLKPALHLPLCSDSPNPLAGQLIQPKRSLSPSTNDCGVPLPPSKPKIWSLADTAASKTPPPTVQQQHHSIAGHHHQQQHHPHWLSSVNVGGFGLAGSMSSGYSSRYGSLLSSANMGSNGSYNCSSGDIATDTPPQTPPNLKLPSMVTSLPFSSGQYGNTGRIQAAATATTPPQHSLMGSNTEKQFMGNVGVCQQGSNEATAFRPVYKSSPSNMADFVSLA